MRALRHPRGPVAVAFDFTEEGVVRATQVAPAELEVEAAWLEQVTRALWGLDDEAEEAARHLSTDATLGQLARRFAGLRLLRAASPFEALQVAVLGQQVSVAAARSIRRRVREQMGESLTAGRLRLSLYPSESSLLEASDEELRAAGVSAAKARTLRAVALAARSGGLPLAALGDPQARRRQLLALPGVGPWTSEVVLMRGFGETDAFPASDLGLLDAVRKLAGLERRPTPRELEAWSAAWSPWRAYAALYLWTFLNPAGA